ncbi:glutathione peroxidase [Acinetobacter rathckeae]|uniref:glutathione peroxidase n=1 Tax=Acinetobacter rathckeae TaxID=2605272 RepID=UPI0018A2F535|nr:glutathione peroxidase [Acinetobacter rathckeae]MBF7688765.1 glutathione peroxidase [Acinetobacter rathckeae]MBF7696242.1 glutathione peroxidase [Acinetobacter rathckeae]
MAKIYDIPVQNIKGQDSSLKSYEGQVIVVVNTASKCGLTPQYEGLQKLYHDKKSQGLTILGFPANNFLQQEPASNDEIEQFCSLNYQVDFPLFAKISVLGEDKHPLYQYLTTAQPKRIGGEAFTKKLKAASIAVADEPEILWNFEKFVIGKNGNVVARFSPDTVATDATFVKCIESELAK